MHKGKKSDKFFDRIDRTTQRPDVKTPESVVVQFHPKLGSTSSVGFLRKSSRDSSRATYPRHLGHSHLTACWVPIIDFPITRIRRAPRTRARSLSIFLLACRVQRAFPLRGEQTNSRFPPTSPRLTPPTYRRATPLSRRFSPPFSSSFVPTTAYTCTRTHGQSPWRAADFKTMCDRDLDIFPRTLGN